MSSFLEGIASDLDPYDTIPVVSTIYSAPLRACIGIVQVVAGTAFSLLASIEYLLSRDEKFRILAHRHVQEIKNGWGNLATACIAAIPYFGNRYLAGRTSQVILQRDGEGFYKIPPRAKIPGIEIGAWGSFKANEFVIKQGNSVFLDTKAKIIPPGWELRD